MKKIFIKIICLAVCMMSAVFCQAHSGEGKPNPHHFFDFIARDLRLNETQQAQLETVKNKLFETDRDMITIQLSELETLVNMIETNGGSDEAISDFEKKSTENKIQFHTSKAQAMREFYNILDDNQKKMFVENMRSFKKGYDAQGKNKRPGFAKSKQPNDRDRKGPPHGGRFDKKGDKFGKAGHPHKEKHYRHKPMAKKGGKKSGHFSHSPRPRPFYQAPLNKYTLLNRELVRELYLSKEQTDAFFKIKEELAAKWKEVCENKCQLPKDVNEMMLSSDDTEQLKNIIAEKLNKSEEYDVFMLKKYFEFCSLLTSEQKNVLLLKYKYQIARMKLSKKNDR